MNKRKIIKEVLTSEPAKAAASGIVQKLSGVKFDRIKSIDRIGQYNIWRPVTFRDWQLQKRNYDNMPEWWELAFKMCEC